MCASLATPISDCARESLIKTTGGLFSHDIALHMQADPAVKEREFVEPEEFLFKDDGVFPNSALPLLLYRQAFTAEAEDLASVIEQRFAENDWTNSWRNGVYSFAHYHSTTHEALGVYCGSAILRLGGELGKNVAVHAGDVFVIRGELLARRLNSPRVRHDIVRKSFCSFKISLVARVWLLRASQSVGHRNGDLPGTARVQGARHNFGGFRIFARQTGWRRSAR